jgi:hypothetical protein
VNVAKTVDDLLKDNFGIGLLQSPSLSDIVEQVTPRAEFHDNDDVLFSLNGLINLNDVVMPQFKEKTHLLHQFLLLGFIS